MFFFSLPLSDIDFFKTQQLAYLYSAIYQERQSDPKSKVFFGKISAEIIFSEEQISRLTCEVRSAGIFVKPTTARKLGRVFPKTFCLLKILTEASKKIIMY